MTTYDVGYYRNSGNERVVVINMPLDDLLKLAPATQQQHIVAEFKVRGVLSSQVAEVWAKKMAEQLNQFETANAAVAKML